VEGGNILQHQKILTFNRIKKLNKKINKQMPVKVEKEEKRREVSQQNFKICQYLNKIKLYFPGG
jgi:hypothetical protein